MCTGKVVLIEAMFTASNGSEGGLAESWIEAVCMMPEVSRVIVLTSSVRESIHSKELVFSFSPARESWVRLFRLCKVFHVRVLVAFGYKLLYALFYMHWLHESARRAKSIAKSFSVDLAMHVSFSSLLFGSRLGILKKSGVRVVVSGSLPVLPPPALNEYCGALDRLVTLLAVPICRLFGSLSNVDTIACVNLGTLSVIVNGFPSTRSELCYDGFKPLPVAHKIKRVLYVDRPDVKRKGRDLLLAALRQNNGESPVPLIIFSPVISDWSRFKNVETMEYLPEQEFEQILSSSQFVLCVSAREGLNTTVARGATAGCIPIVSSLTGFEELDTSACLKLDPQKIASSELVRCLNVANSMTPDEKERMSENAMRWALPKAQSCRLQDCVRRWLSL